MALDGRAWGDAEVLSPFSRNSHVGLAKLTVFRRRAPQLRGVDGKDGTQKTTLESNYRRFGERTLRSRSTLRRVKAWGPCHS